MNPTLLRLSAFASAVRPQFMEAFFDAHALIAER
jgi:hypothetical protein